MATLLRAGSQLKATMSITQIVGFGQSPLVWITPIFLFLVSAAGQGLLINGGFETFEGDGIAWQYSGGANSSAKLYGWAPQPDRPRTGSRFLDLPTSDPYGTPAIASQKLDATAGQVWTFNGYVRTSYNEPINYANTVLSILYQDEAGTILGKFDKELIPDTTWAFAELSGMAPEGTTKVSFSANAFHIPESSGRVFFDDLFASVSPVPELTVTGIAAVVFVAVAAILPEVRRILRRLR